VITSNLYEEALLGPARVGGDELVIVSGYASATFSRRHIEDLLKQVSDDFVVKLIIGMSSRKSDHLGFIDLLNDYPKNFEGYYYCGRPEVHSKIYAWFVGGESLSGFSGSANYSQYGFFEEKQKNHIVGDDPIEILQYFSSLLPESIPIREYELSVNEIIHPLALEGSLPPAGMKWLEPNVSARISFLGRDGELPPRSGMNWGYERYGRKAYTGNETEIRIRKDATKEGFLPEKAHTFTLVTDDGKSFDCRVQQDNRKGVASTNNSIFGEYIRKRLGVELGEKVATADLVRYGRTDFVLKKLDEETFLFDFSVSDEKRKDS